MELVVNQFQELSQEELFETDGGVIINPITVRLAVGIVHAWSKTPAGQATITKVVSAASSGFGAGMLAKQIFD